MPPENLVEVSYEVGNKVGGIHQVIRTKASSMKDFYGDGYFTVGYYDEEKARDEFAPRECPVYLSRVLEKLESEGIKCHCGVWRVSGSPHCILIDPEGMDRDLDEVKSRLWDEYDVDSLDAGEEFDDPVAWSYAAGRFVNELEKELEEDTVVHLHEWLSGPAMLEVSSPVVFTTHATVLGRALSNSDYDLHGAVKDGNVPESLATDYGVSPRHQLEKAAARESDVFTTVSDFTAMEAEAVLDVEPDMVLPNGLNIAEFPSLEELSYQHKEKKDEMKEFLQAYFEPYYDIDLENDPRILFISGRYEFHNKGIDVFLDALSEVNKNEGEDFFVFFFIPSDVSGVSQEVLENMSLFQELEDYVESLIPQVRTTLLNSLTSEEDAGENLKQLVEGTAADVEPLKRSFHERMKKNPPLAAHDLNYGGDRILEKMEQEGLNNSKDDRVKVVFYPTYLSVGDKLLSMSYTDAITACSAGIFPSYYEPWGYTPVETAAHGALSVTTDLAGFGQFLVDNTDEEDRKGIRVLERDNVTYGEAVQELAGMIEDTISYSKTEITERKHNARRLAQMTSWEKLADNYVEAHEKAVEGGAG